MRTPRIASCLAVTLLLTALPLPLAAQEAGETIVRHTPARQDLYLAGGSVEVLATVDGDLVVAGGHVAIAEAVNGDVMAAGGTISVRGKVGDDLRVAGGTVVLAAEIGDDALAAGGTVTVLPTTRIAGRAWLAGGQLDINGNIGKELKATGGRIVLSAEVHGDVMLAGESIELGPKAVIHGTLRYLSPREARIDERARIVGGLTRLPGEPHAAPRVPRAGVGIGFALSLMVTGAVLLLLFPRAAPAATTQLRATPWRSLGLGLAVFATTPLVIVLLFVTVLGAWLALIALAAYLVALLIAFLLGTLCLGETLLMRMRGADTLSRGMRLAALLVPLPVVIGLGWVPVFGTLLNLGLLLFGLGALAHTGYRALASEPAAGATPRRRARPRAR